MCLRTTRGGGPFFQVNSWNDLLQDKDDDGMDASAAYQWLQIESTKMQFFELVDPWGNPLVYIPRESYDEEFTILTADDEYVTVKARNIQTGNSGELPPHFVIWSFGKNGINEDGGGDDITSWTKGDDN